MSSKIKAVIISSIVLVLIIGAMVALKLTEKTDSDSSSSSSEASSTTSKLLYEEKPENVALVNIKNSEGEYEITQVDDTNWTIEEFENAPLDSSFLSGIANAVTSVTAQQVIEENAADLSKYGLSDPVAEVKVTFKDSDKTVKELLIGNETPSSSSYSYFAFKGEKTVYTVSTSQFTSMTAGKYSAINTVILATPETDTSGAVAYPVIKDINIKRSDLAYNVKLAYEAPDETEDSATASAAALTSSAETDSTHVMTEPVKADLNDEKATPVIRGMFGLTASKVIAVNPTPDELANAGITTPAVVVTTELEDKTYILTIGSEIKATDSTEAGYYGYVEGTDVLYQFSTASLPWLTFNTDDLASDLISLINIYELAKLEIITNSDDLKFEFSGDDSDTFTAKKNGVEMDGDYFRKFYQFVLSAPAESIWLEDPTSTTPDVKFIYTKEDGTVSNLEFYNTNDRQTIIKYNGMTYYKCRTSYIERLLANIALLDDKGEIVFTW